MIRFKTGNQLSQANSIQHTDMKQLRTLLLILIAACMAMPSQAKKKTPKEPEIITIYVFGVAQNMTDSTVYVTNIAPVNGATMLEHNQLKNFIYYTEQFQKYVEETYSQQHISSAFFYARDRKTIEKRFARATEKIKKSALYEPKFVYVSTDDFHFRVPVIKTFDEE